MHFSIRNKLFLGFSSILLMLFLFGLMVFIKLNAVTNLEHKIVAVGQPSVIAGLELETGIERTLAGLRGYIILGSDEKKAQKFIADRAAGWKGIKQALSNLDTLSEHWEEPETLQILAKLHKLFDTFEQSQNEIEQIAHLPDNIPAYQMLLDEAAPTAGKVVAAITQLINYENDLSATKARKTILKLFADSRGSFALSLANIRAYLLSGDQSYIDKFHERWSVNEERYQQLLQYVGQFSNQQKEAWNDYKTLRAEFSPYPNKMFDLRTAPDWNKANYWLGTKAAPKAVFILEELSKLKQYEKELQMAVQAEFDNEISQMRYYVIIGIILSLGVGIFVSLYMSNIISKPLGLITRRAKLVASCDLSSEQLEISNNDELGELTDSINAMSNDLRAVIKSVSESSSSIDQTSEILSVNTGQTSRNISEQQSRIEQMATAMNEMTATVQEVGENISGTADAAKEANQETLLGNQVVASTIAEIKALSNQIQKGTEAIQKLEKDSEAISSVMDVIVGVAEQTNLLALNAAIEAARAGEQGRGFAVVADEVRTLAGRTQESTAEISSVVEKLQSGSRAAAEVMQKSSEQAGNMVEQAAKAGQSLEAIASSVETINQMSIQIATASEQQSATVEEINRNVMGISDMSVDNSKSAEESASVSKELAGLGKNLSEVVNRFKL